MVTLSGSSMIYRNEHQNPASMGQTEQRNRLTSMSKGEYVINRRAAAAVVLGVLTLSGCTSDAEPPPPQPSPTTSAANTVVSPTTEPKTPEEKAAAAALVAYEGFWKVSAQADADPDGRKDFWRAKLKPYVAEPELSLLVDEIKHLASLPAHSEGAYKRSPKVKTIDLDANGVYILDCLDRSDVALISEDPEKHGKRNLDSPKQPERYQMEARVGFYPNPKPGRWRVQNLDARLEEPC